jgi:hypothetical protein
VSSLERTVGAQIQQAPLTRALSEAIGGSGRLVLLVGEAGIGKTTTARGVAAAARRDGVTVRWSACWSGGATVAHAPWLTLLSGLGAPGRQAMDALVGSGSGDAASAAAARTSAYAGVGDRRRVAGPDPVERLRKAVSARVRDAIRRIESVHPSLGRHLSNAIRTGTYCSYEPEGPTVWRCQTRSGGDQS